MGTRILTLLVVSITLILSIPVFSNADNTGLSPRLTLESEDGQNSLTFGLAVQLMYTYLEKDKGPDVHADYLSNLTWRRVRPSIKGGMLGGDLSFYLHLSTAPGALEMMDYYVNYEMSPMLRFRIGQCKIPFTRYRIQSFKNLQLVDWSPVTRYFGAERQLGIAIHSGYEKPTAIEYEFGVFNGLNSRKSHTVGFAEITGEKVGNASDLVDPAPLDEFHPALALHLAYNHNHIVSAYDTDFEKRGFRVSGGLSAVWDANPVMHRDYALRLSPELLMKAYGFALSGIYYVGFFEREGDIAQTDIALTGAVAQASYLIGKVAEFALRYSYIGTTEQLRKDARKRAYDILSDDTVEGYDELAKQYKEAGTMYALREYAVGFNIYMVGRSLKLQNDFSWISHEDFTGDNLLDLRVRSQLQLAF